MPIAFYHVLHVLSVIVLVACGFVAVAAPRPDIRKRVLAISGVAATLALIAGFGLQAKLQLGFPLWLLVKIVCWIALAALAGMPFRRPERGTTWAGAYIALAVIALVMVYYRPF